MENQAAIVTGAAQVIGRSIALRLADDGFNVCVTDLPAKIDLLDDLATLIKMKGRLSLAVTADISSEEDVQRMVSETLANLDGLDVMVANAGIAPLKFLEDWDHL
ncbi:hypothetical protein B0H13DRAFT_2380510 [Mycena leptocephala]|nr:hypothetical protein B0H13DRAFT_2380510 [Mycena leptocephala]